MSSHMSSAITRLGDPQRVDVDIVIPVYNEQDALERSVLALCGHLYETRDDTSPFTWNVVIAGNASTDATWAIARTLHDRWPHNIRALHIDRKGRGFALKVSWMSSRARVVAYMDADLSTDIRHTGQLVLPLLLGDADLTCGCRLDPRASVTRSWTRETISRTYNQMLRSYLDARFRDAQCGFKAMTREAAHALLPYVEDDEWFFDTELLMKAQWMGMRLLEIPVHWVEDAGTTVDIPDTVAKDLTGMRRLRRERPEQSVTTSGTPAGSDLSWDERGQHTLPGSLILVDGTASRTPGALQTPETPQTPGTTEATEGTPR
ncbi:glycosyltransferase [uncultured Bifidobacterium sp.]|uniref:glycosyltransferase n=1 Tax=uncultured Bifidobacterium sp. TaxID=165187 RepID=UPI00261E5FD2|nr:glycosyltransferase [uncultured Bifidobacterium sp.]